MDSLAEGNSSKGWVRVKPGTKHSADEFWTKEKRAFGLEVNDNFKIVKKQTDEIGLVHHRYQQTYKEIPVEGAEYILHEEFGFVTLANGKLVEKLNMSVTPSISEEVALQKALNYIGGQKYGWEAKNITNGKSYSEYPEGELLLALISPEQGLSASNYALAYKFSIVTIEPEYRKTAIYVGAQTGEIIRIANLLRPLRECANGSANTLFDGVQEITTEEHGAIWTNFWLVDNCRGGGIQTFQNSYNVTDGDNIFEDTHDKRMAASAHWAAEKTYDYFLNVWGRDSYDGNGSILFLNTGLSGYNRSDQAWWDDGTISLGVADVKFDYDLVSLDIVAHEFTHGVTESSADLEYLLESGALNESFSDIFGSMVEFYASNNGNTGNYYLAEDCIIGGLRSMYDPKSKNQPDTYKGEHWDHSTSTTDEIIVSNVVHSNSGVQNYWFYLLAEGGTGVNDNGDYYSVQGIGKEKASKIAYRNLTRYLTMYSDYSDAKNGAIWAAIDLFGTCSNEVLQTIKAWDAVGVISEGGVAYDQSLACQKINDHRINNADYTAHAIRDISLGCEITATNGNLVHLIAGRSITLNPGFGIDANFTAEVISCLNIPYKNDEIVNVYDQLDYRNTPRNVESLSQSIPNEAMIYPNPTKGIFYVNRNKPENANLTVQDMNGRVIYHCQMLSSKISIDLRSFPKGSYVVCIEHNKEITTHNLIVN